VRDHPRAKPCGKNTGKGIPFVFTGFSEAVKGSRHEGRRILRKPVTDEEVLAALDQMIESVANKRT
jgi:hypothetical protein